METNSVLAKIGDVEIRQKDIDYMKKSMDKRLLAQFQGTQGEFYLLQELINQKLMTIDAKSSDLLENEDFKFEFESMKDNFISQYVIKRLLNSVEVTDKELKEFYEANQDSFGETDSVSARHILVGDLEKAEKLYNEISSGEDFSKVAKEHSTCPSSKQGGDLGFFGKGQMVKEFEDMAFSLEIGELSKPVKTQFGYHLIIVDDKRKEEKQNFEDIKNELKETVLAKKQQEAYVNKINELRKKYNVK